MNSLLLQMPWTACTAFRYCRNPSHTTSFTTTSLPQEHTQNSEWNPICSKLSLAYQCDIQTEKNLLATLLNQS